VSVPDRVARKLAGELMVSTEVGVCSRAKAYLKVKEFGTSGNEITLPYRDSPIITDLNDNLCVAYVVDEGGHFQYLANRDREASGLSNSEIHSASIENLAKLARARIRVAPHGNVHAVLLEGNFEASMILIDGLWDKALAHLAPNGFVAAIPARDILAFCDTNSTAGIAELLQLIQRIEHGDHLLSRELLQRTKAGWSGFNRQ
jgi:hypothetical protein